MNFLNTNKMRMLLILSVTLAGAIWLKINGPVPVIRASSPTDEIVPYWYMLSAFPVLGMLIGDFVGTLSRFGIKKRTINLGIQILILILISSLRLDFNIPISGHALLFSFFIFRRIIEKSGESLFSKIELLVTVILLLMTGYIKLFWWDDPLTLSIGITAGLALSTPALLLNFRNN